MSTATAAKVAACATGLDAPLPHSFAEQKASIGLEKWEGPERSHLILLFSNYVPWIPSRCCNWGARSPGRRGSDFFFVIHSLGFQVRLRDKCSNA